jgi:hypothetical protein
MHKGYVERNGKIEQVIEDGWCVPKTSWLLTTTYLAICNLGHCQQTHYSV